MSQASGDIAIIGMSCIYPKAPNVETFWRNILSKVDAVSEPPESRGFDDYFDPESTANDRIYCKKGGFIDEFSEFNPLEFGIMPDSVEGSSPEQFLALRVAREALADAGYLDRPFDRKRTGLILGHGLTLERGQITCLQHGQVVDQTMDILKRLHPETSKAELQAIKQELKANLPPFKAETCPGLISNILTGRIANRLDLQGPSYTVDAACASSLIALDLGMRDLLTHRCDMVIVGGVQVSTSPGTFMVFCLLGAISRRGRLRPFDKDADGTLLGEGIGMMVIKRREDAVRDGDRIYAIIKEKVGLASDGRGAGVLVPRFEGELLALERAYESSGIPSDTIGMIEAHGTATTVGDIAEIQALTQMFGFRNGPFPRCAIGSVKSMISHTIPAAGMASLIKSALSLYHKILPPTLCDKANPALELEKTPFYVNTETRPWIHGEPQPRRVGVNAFGFGGINAHAILEEYTGHDDGEEPPLMLYQWDTEVIIVQSESREGLIGSGKRLLRFISANPEAELKDIAYTLNCALRESATYRLAIVAKSSKDLEKKLGYGLNRLADLECHEIKDRSGIFFFEKPLGREGKLAFLFPGEGSQYVNMFSDLCIQFPEVRMCFDRVDMLFLKNGRNPLPSQVVFPAPQASSEERAVSERILWKLEYAVNTVFAANHGLNALLDKLEIRPQAVVGHSTGEDAAMLASGVVVEQDEKRLLKYDFEIDALHNGQIPVAKLMAVGASTPAVIAGIAAESGGEIYVAMDNCPNQAVLCGSEAAIEGAYERLKNEGAICNFLPFDRGYHTPWYRAVCEQHARPFVEQLEIEPPRIDIYSCATTRPYPQNPDEIRHIMVEQWALPVRFRETIEAMYDAGVRIFVEVGPKENLTSFVEDTLDRRRYVAVAANVPARSGIFQLNYMVGLLAAHDVPMRLDYLYARRNPQRLPIHEGVEKSVEETLEGAKKTKSKPGTMKLSLAIPKLTLDERTHSVSTDGEYLSQTTSEAPEVTQTPGHKPIRTEMHTHGGAMSGDSALASTVSGGSPAARTEQSRVLSRQSRLRSEVMQEYLRSMERFLELQQGIMGTYLDKKTTRPGPEARRVKEGSKEHVGRKDGKHWA